MYNMCNIYINILVLSPINTSSSYDNETKPITYPAIQPTINSIAYSVIQPTIILFYVHTYYKYSSVLGGFFHPLFIRFNLIFKKNKNTHIDTQKTSPKIEEFESNFYT